MTSDNGEELAFIVKDEHAFVGLTRCHQRNRPLRLVRSVLVILLDLTVLLDLHKCRHFMLPKAAIATTDSTQ